MIQNSKRKRTAPVWYIFMGAFVLFQLTLTFTGKNY